MDESTTPADPLRRHDAARADAEESDGGHSDVGVDDGDYADSAGNHRTNGVHSAGSSKDSKDTSDLGTERTGASPERAATGASAEEEDEGAATGASAPTGTSAAGAAPGAPTEASNPANAPSEPASVTTSAITTEGGSAAAVSTAQAPTEQNVAERRGGDRDWSAGRLSVTEAERAASELRPSWEAAWDRPDVATQAAGSVAAATDAGWKKTPAASSWEAERSLPSIVVDDAPESPEPPVSAPVATSADLTGGVPALPGGRSSIRTIVVVAVLALVAVVVTVWSMAGDPAPRGRHAESQSTASQPPTESGSDDELERERSTAPSAALPPEASAEAAAAQAATAEAAAAEAAAAEAAAAEAAAAEAAAQATRDAEESAALAARAAEEAAAEAAREESMRAAEAARAEAAARAAAARTVRVTLRASPSAATFTHRGAPVASPLEREAGTTLDLLASAPGHEPESVRVTFDRDRTVRVSLRRTPAPRPAPTAMATPMAPSRMTTTMRRATSMSGAGFTTDNPY